MYMLKDKISLLNHLNVVYIMLIYRSFYIIITFYIMFIKMLIYRKLSEAKGKTKPDFLFSKVKGLTRI